MRKGIMTIASLVLAALAPCAGAWSPEGHEIIGRMAAFYLTPAARQGVEEILDGQKLGDYEVASWPDLIRGTKEYEEIYPGNGRWHFIDFNVTQRYDKQFELKQPEDGQDIVTQIGRWRDVLASETATPELRRDALRFLVHFIGDIHQPLHCAYRYGDMGGNMIPVESFQGRHYFFGGGAPLDYASSIHSVWDVAMVQELLAGRTPAAVAKQLCQEIAPEELARWRGNTPLRWAVDSYWHARKNCYRWANGQNLPFKWARPGMDLTSENYIDARLPLAREQLQKAGVRLAHLLNGVFDPVPAE